MTGRDCDIAIAGGGLAGGLIALALAQQRPDITFRLIEGGPDLGGNHRWSWFASDLGTPAQDLLQPVRTTRWHLGNAVVFPGHRRQLNTPYCSIGSADFAAALHRELPQGTIMTSRTVTSIDAHGLTLGNGERIGARAVIDARGFVPSPHIHGGWQVFMGRHLRLDRPHGLERPIIMDASVAQLGGYRFVYVLPLGSHELFVEDTYYQDTPALDRGALAERIDAYCAAQGWTGETLSEETGVLPVITGGSHQRYFDHVATPGVALAGARGLFTHPLTSYTLPFAARVALAVVENADLPGEQLAARLADLSRRHWAQTGFYRLLGTMLFGAAEPHSRVAIFERFYRLPEGLVERFYTGSSTIADKARVLIGKPPVPIHRALHALTSNRPPLIPQTESLPS